MSYIAIGKAVNTHGLKGELKIESWSDFDDVRYQKGNTVYIWQNNSYKPVVVATYRNHKGHPLVSFEGLQDINLIEQYKGALICIRDTDRKPLENGEFYADQLRGLRAEDESGTVIGTIMDLEGTSGAQNNLRIEMDNGKTVLIPYIDEFIRSVDLEKQVVVIHREEGLL